MFQPDQDFEPTQTIDVEGVASSQYAPSATQTATQTATYQGMSVKTFKERYELSRDAFIRVRRKAKETMPELDFDPINIKGINYVQFPEILINFLPAQKTDRSDQTVETQERTDGDLDVASEAEKALMRGDLEAFAAILEHQNDRYEKETTTIVTTQKEAIATQNETAKRIKKAADKQKQLEAERKVKLDREQFRKELLAEIHSETLSVVNPTRS